MLPLGNQTDLHAPSYALSTCPPGCAAHARLLLRGGSPTSAHAISALLRYKPTHKHTHTNTHMWSIPSVYNGHARQPPHMCVCVRLRIMQVSHRVYSCMPDKHADQPPHVCVRA